MKKLLLILMFVPLVSFGQDFKVVRVIRSEEAPFVIVNENVDSKAENGDGVQKP